VAAGQVTTSGSVKSIGVKGTPATPHCFWALTQRRAIVGYGHIIHRTAEPVAPGHQTDQTTNRVVNQHFHEVTPRCRRMRADGFTFGLRASVVIDIAANSVG